MLKDRIHDTILEKTSLARKITINDDGNIISGTIILDKGRKHFIGLSDDKEARIIGEFKRRIVNDLMTPEIEEKIYVYVIKDREKEKWFFANLAEKSNVTMKPITNISQSKIDEIKKANRHIRIERVNEHTIKIVCEDATSSEFRFHTRKINKEAFEEKLVHPGEILSKHSHRIRIIAFCTADSFCLEHNIDEEKSNRCVDSTIYLISKGNIVYKIVRGGDVLVVNRLTYHDANHPFAFNDLWEKCNVNISFGKRHEDLIRNERIYHIDDLRFMLDFSAFPKDLTIANHKHDLGCSSPFYIGTTYSDMDTIKELPEDKKREIGIVLMRLKELEEEIRSIDGTEYIFPHNLFNCFLGEAFNSKLVREITQINALCNNGASYKNAARNSVSTGKITIKNKMERFEEIITFDENRESFIGVSTKGKDTLISGNLMPDGKVVMSLKSEDREVSYSGDLSSKPSLVFEDNSGHVSIVKYSPILGYDDEKIDIIRKRFSDIKTKKL